VSTKEWVSALLPFIVAYCIQLLNFSVRPLAKGALKIIQGDAFTLDGESPRDFVVDLAALIYAQLSFFSSLMVSAGTALASVLSSKHEELWVAVVLVLLLLLIVWFIRWQVSVQPESSVLRRRREGEMNWTVAGATTLLLVGTIAVQDKTVEAWLWG
jgi:hypothetical protein